MAGARPSSSLWSLVRTGYAAFLSFGFPVRSAGLAIACGGSAMLPTFESRPGDRGDVVLIRRQGHHLFEGVVSRLIALPGDLVRLRATREVGEVPEGHCWVEGDNPRESMDSRHYGPVPLDLLEGTVTHIVWPPRRMAAVHGRIPQERFRLLINPAGSVEEDTWLSCLADSTVSDSEIVRPRGVPSPASTAQEEELCRKECNFVYFRGKSYAWRLLVSLFLSSPLV